MVFVTEIENQPQQALCEDPSKDSMCTPEKGDKGSTEILKQISPDVVIGMGLGASATSPRPSASGCVLQKPHPS